MAEDMNLEINIQGVNGTGPSFEAVNSAISAVTESLTGLNRAALTASESVSRMGQSGGNAARTMESSVAGAQQSLRNVGDAAVNAGGSIDQLSRAISTEMIGQQLEHIGEVGMKAFEACVHSAADFEYNISRIGAVLTTVGKASNSQMNQMSEDALKLGSKSSFSANEIAEGMYTLARQGLDASTILGDGVNGAINIVNDLAQATDSTLTDTATVITDVVHEYGLSGGSLREVANIMSGALHNSSESLDDFYQSMKQVGPIAANMHQNVNDMSTALALLAQHGITGSSAGTALKNMLLGLAPHTKKAAEMMHDLGISAKDGAADSFYQLNGNLKPLPEIIDILNQKFGGLNDKQKQAALATTFTKYGLAGLNVVVGESRDKFLEFQNELKADDAATIAGKKMNNLHGDLLKFNAGVQTMMKSFGDSINASLRPLVQHISEAVKWITELPKPVKEFGMVLLGLVSTVMVAGGAVIGFTGAFQMLGPTLAMAGFNVAKFAAFTEFLGTAFTGFLLPALGVIAVIAAVGLGFKLAYDHIKPFHDAVNNVVNAVKQVGIALKGMWGGGSGAGKGISILNNLGFSDDAINKVQTVIAVIKSGISGLETVFNNVKSSVQGIFMILTGTGGGKGVSILQKLGFDKETIQNLMVIGGQIQAAFNSIKNTISQVIGQIGTIIHTFVSQIFSFWESHGQQMSQSSRNTWNMISNIVHEVINVLSGIFSWFASNVLPIITSVFHDVFTTIFSVLNQVVKVVFSAVGAIYNFWMHIWPEVSAIFQKQWNVIKIVLFPIIANVVGAITVALTTIRAMWDNGWKAIVAILKVAWDLIKGAIQVAWHVISGVIEVFLDLATGHWSKAWKDFKNIFVNVWHDITGGFKNLINDAFDFGKNFALMLAKGITSYIGAVGKAVSGVASQIKKFLGFSSPTEEGPASTSDKWAPNFVNMMAKGIQDHIPTIQSAVSNVALGIQAGFTTPLTQNVNSQLALPSGYGGSNVYNITVNANGNITQNEHQLGDMVARALINKTKMQGKI